MLHVLKNSSSMMLFSMIIIFGCIGTTSNLILPPNVSILENPMNGTSDNTSIFQIINTLYEVNHYPQSLQLKECLADDNQNMLKLVMNVTQSATLSGSVELSSLLSYIEEYINEYIKKPTKTCVLLSHDAFILRSIYIDRYHIIDLFLGSILYQQYMIKNYKAAHAVVKSLENLLISFQYHSYAKLLDQFLKDIFNSKDIAEDQWSKLVTSLENTKASEYYGITAANGVIGAVSSYTPFKIEKTVLAGAYEKFGRGRVDNLLETFPAMFLEVEFNHQQVQNNYYNYNQEFNFKNAQFTGTFSTSECSVSYKYYALKNLPFAFYTVIEVSALTDGPLILKNWHDTPSYLNDVRKSFQTLSNGPITIMYSKAFTKIKKMEFVAASSFIISDDSNIDKNTEVTHEDWEWGKHFMKMEVNAKKGQKYKIGLLTSLISSEHHDDPENEAIRIIIRGYSIGEKAMIDGHKLMWNNLWKNDIIIEGNTEDQKNVRLMLYHCYAFINEFYPYGVSPMGLSGLGYNGHVFWDMDLWIYPGILLLNPNLAKSLIQYRYQRVEAAKNNAFINGYRGAMFPWESSKSGAEETPVWALPGPLQHHISGCVAFAAWNYYCVTQDLQWLKTKGYEIIHNVAQFWTSRVQKETDGFYHIKNVVCADQWAENVDDNAFTNAVASTTLRIANSMNKLLSLPQNPLYQEIATKLVILKLEKQNVTRQHNRYNGQNIKQADVNLLSFPLKYIQDNAQIIRDLEYYRVKIPNEGTPAMTYSIFTILYSRLKDQTNSYKLFQESFAPYLKKPFNVFAQTKGGTNPYFLTGAGGVLQSMIYGFAGYDITDKGVVKIATVIPKEWKSVKVIGFVNQIQKEQGISTED